MQLDDSCMFNAIRVRAIVLSSLHMLEEGMVSQKFQPRTPPVARLALSEVMGGATAYPTAFSERHKDCLEYVLALFFGVIIVNLLPGMFSEH